MEDKLFDKLKELSGMISDNFNVIDEPIDMQLQMDYFKRSKKVKSEIADKDIDIDEISDLLNPETGDEQLMDQMIMLAAIDDPKAFRILEDYAKDKSHRLHQWAMMAMQESKMLIEGSLLNERQVFVSTGLGGRGNSLRYFVVLIGNNVEEFVPYQQHAIQSEFETALKNNRSEMEKLEFEGKFAAMTVLMPLDIPFHKVLLSAVEQCNELGNFLNKDFLITNVKVLSFDEIKDIVDNNNVPSPDDYEFDIENGDGPDDTDSDDDQDFDNPF